MSDTLQEKLGYCFKREELLLEALTHSSVALEKRSTGGRDYQRLEFLGDAVLQLSITLRLYSEFPDYPEGQLTKMRTRLVNRQTLARIGTNLDLGEYLQLGRGEEQLGGRKRPSNLADAMEAVIGAVFQDGGFEPASAFIFRMWAEDIDQLRHQPHEINPKGDLQELLQGKAREKPIYEIVAESGKDHDKFFEARVLWEGRELGRGSGRSKKEAESLAAERALEILRQSDAPETSS